MSDNELNEKICDIFNDNGMPCDVSFVRTQIKK